MIDPDKSRDPVPVASLKDVDEYVTALETNETLDIAANEFESLYIPAFDDDPDNKRYEVYGPLTQCNENRPLHDLTSFKVANTEIVLNEYELAVFISKLVRVNRRSLVGTITEIIESEEP